MFHSGIARIAIIITAPVRDSTDWMATNLATKTVTRPHHGTSSNPLWNHGLSRESQAGIGLKVDWTNDFIHAAKAGASTNSTDSLNGHKVGTNAGIGCPEPLGIVTHEDIIDCMMQKKSSDEKTFFGHDKGNLGSMASSIKNYRNPEDVGAKNSTLRKRTKSAQHFGMDGHQDDGYSRSEYTNNSLGGFHGADESEIAQTKADLSHPEALLSYHADASSHNGGTSCLVRSLGHHAGSIESLGVSIGGQTETSESHKKVIECHTPTRQSHNGRGEGQMGNIGGLLVDRGSPKVRAANASAAIEESPRKARLASLHLETGKALSPERKPGSPKRRSLPTRFDGSGARISPTSSEETAATGTDNGASKSAEGSGRENRADLELGPQHFQQHGLAYIEHQKKSQTLLPGQKMNILSSPEKAQQIQDEKDALARFKAKARTLANLKPKAKPKGKNVIRPKESTNILGEAEQEILKKTSTKRPSPMTDRSSESSMPELSQKTKSGKPAPIFLPPTPQTKHVEVSSSRSRRSSESSMPKSAQKTKSGKPTEIILPPTPQTKGIEVESKPAKKAPGSAVSRPRNLTNSGLVAPNGEVRPRDSR